jgi:hypothetical protein
MSTHTWIVKPTSKKEATQSNTYGPLIALGIDSAKVTFPDTWETTIFKPTVAEFADPLPFSDIATFKVYVQSRLTSILGDTKLATFLSRCDNPAEYHLPGRIQEAILYNADPFLEYFFGLLVLRTKANFAGRSMVLTFTAGGRRKSRRSRPKKHRFTRRQ